MSKIHTVNGFTGNLSEIAKKYNINYQSLNSRLKRGMSIEKALYLPNQKDKKYKINNFTGNLKEISIKYNIKYNTLSKRIKNGITIEKAIITPKYLNYSKPKIYTIYKFTGNLTEISKKFNIKYEALTRNIRKGLSIEEIFDLLKK